MDLIAARDGAMSIYHFNESITVIQTNLASCPSAANPDIRKHLKQAKRQLRGWFPDLENIRHSVAHAAELGKYPKRVKDRTSTAEIDRKFIRSEKGAPPLRIEQCLEERNFIYTLENRIISYEISAKTLDRLGKIRKKVFDVFQEGWDSPY